MKSDIHPQYYLQATIECACGKKWKAGSTKSEILVAICSACHPFYSGQEKIVDSRGRVERFKKRMEKTVEKTHLGKKVVKTRTRKKS